MDLSALRIEDVVDFVILDFDGMPTDIVFKLAGPAHPAAKEAERKFYRQNARDYNKRGKAAIPEDIDVLRERETERLVARTLGWEGLTDGGKPLEFSTEKAKELYDNDAMPFRQRVTDKLIAMGRFMKDSSTN